VRVEGKLVFTMQSVSRFTEGKLRVRIILPFQRHAICFAECSHDCLRRISYTTTMSKQTWYCFQLSHKFHFMRLMRVCQND